jgi:phage-related protein
MNDWFEWNGVRCTEYGIHVSQQPAITRAAERATFTNVPGRSGALTTLEGEDVYDDLTLSAECFITDSGRLPEICGWLKGGGKVTFADRPGGFYFARIANQIPFEKILRGHPHRSFVTNFRCQPFWYVQGVSLITLTTSGGIITNPGNVFSEPVITVYGSGDITLMVGLYVVELEGISGSITLDTPLMEAYSGSASMNDNMSGDFPTLVPGINAVSWSGGVARVGIQPNWRYF